MNRECPVDGCDETRVSTTGMEYHLLREHELPEQGDVDLRKQPA